MPRHNRVRWRPLVIGVIVVLGLGLVIAGMRGRLNTLIGELFAIAFLVTGVYGIHKQWWKAGACLTLVIVSACIFFSSQEWMQGFIKQEALRFLLAVSRKAGEKLDDFQKTTEAIQEQVTKQQRELEQQQSNLRNAESEVGIQQGKIKEQYQQVTTMQVELATAQKKIESQQKKVEDVEFLVSNLYSKMVYERVDAFDTNRVVKVRSTNDTVVLCVMLKHAPIPGSLQISVVGNEWGVAQVSFGSLTAVRNMVRVDLTRYDLSKTTMDFHYVIDTRVTNLIESMELVGGKVVAGEFLMDFER